MPTKGSVDRPTRERLIGHLRAIMVEHRLNANQLALRLGVGSGTISQLLSGDRSMGLDLFIKVHRVFRVSANYLLDEDPPGSNPGHTGSFSGRK